MSQYWDTELTDTSTTQQYPAGREREEIVTVNSVETVRYWRYIKNTSGGALAAGLGVMQEEDDPFYGELSGADVPDTRMLGVAQHAIADSSWGWVLFRGVGLIKAGTGDVSAETPVQGLASGLFTDGTAGTDHELPIFALAAAVSGSTCLALLKL